MAKGAKHGGRKAVDNEPRDKTIRVRLSSKPHVERFRDLLDDSDIADTAKAFLEELEQMKDSNKEIDDD